MRTNKLAVTVFALGLAAAYGCSSSNDPNPGQRRQRRRQHSRHQRQRWQRRRHGGHRRRQRPAPLAAAAPPATAAPRRQRPAPAAPAAARPATAAPAATRAAAATPAAAAWPATRQGGARPRRLRWWRSVARAARVSCAMASCTTTTSGSTAMLSAADFCANLIPNCTGITGVAAPYTASMASCMTAYDAAVQQGLPVVPPVLGRGRPRSGGTSSPMTHCPHATGAAPVTPPRNQQFLTR